MRVTSFRNCANPDCAGHHTPFPYSLEVPAYLEELKHKYGELLLCSHCGTVWLEELRLDGQTCYIVRFAGSLNWLKQPVRKDYTLKHPHKTLILRRRI